jgi:hypothetical protein
MPICYMPGCFPRKDKSEARDQALGVAHSDSVWAAASIKEALSESRTASIKNVSAGPHQEWREPPGYLGEAVRRAKRIASSRPAELPKTQDC